MPWIYYGADVVDAVKRLHHALDLDDVDLDELGDDGDLWLVREHAPDGVDLDPKTRATRARQRRWRAKKRDARDAGPRDARDATDDAENRILSHFGGDVYSLPTPFRAREGVSKTPARDARDASRRDADATRDDATRRDAASPALELGALAADLHLTDDEREVGRQRVRELGDALRSMKRDR